MKLGAVLGIGLLCFLCLATIGPVLLKDSVAGSDTFGVQQPREGMPRALNIAASVFVFLIGMVAVMALISAAPDRAAEIEKKQMDAIVARETAEAKQKELDAYRQWAAHHSRPKITSKDDQKGDF